MTAIGILLNTLANITVNFGLNLIRKAIGDDEDHHNHSNLQRRCHLII